MKYFAADVAVGSFATGSSQQQSPAMSAMPRQRSNSATQRNDAMCQNRTHAPQQIASLFERVVTLTQTAPTEATHWTSATIAKVVGISASSVQRIWRAHGLQPHRVKQFKLSTDPRFVDKPRDVVGLYVDPPAHAIVLSVDEKSQIQALVALAGIPPLRLWTSGMIVAGLCKVL